jgi:hypothetical protein
MGYSARNRHERCLSSRHDFAADVEAAGAFQYVERLYRVMMDVQWMKHTDWIAGLERRQMPLSILRSRLHAALGPVEDEAVSLAWSYEECWQRFGHHYAFWPLIVGLELFRRLPGSLAEHHDAHQHGAARARHPDSGDGHQWPHAIQRAVIPEISRCDTPFILTPAGSEEDDRAPLREAEGVAP